MENKYKEIKKELEELLEDGKKMIFGLVKKIDLKEFKKYEKFGEKYFRGNYETWYTKAYSLIKIISPDRLQDFSSYYSPKNNRKGVVDYESYTLKDYMINMSVSRGGSKLFDENNATLSKFQAQYLILESIKNLLESSLLDIRGILQADLFDSEIETAQHLLDNGFIRAAGAICGVVIEKHLSEICDAHKIKITKKNPVISDYNEELKRQSIIDQKQWRFITLMADYRNECDHKKIKEPTQENVQKLVDGTNEIIKTIF